jgi:hypothetical protein
MNEYEGKCVCRRKKWWEIQCKKCGTKYTLDKPWDKQRTWSFLKSAGWKKDKKNAWECPECLKIQK